MPKTVCDLLIKNAQVISMDSSRTIYARGGVAVSGQRIVDVGTDAALAERTEAKEVIDADGGIVHPGFIDAHNHIVYTSCRGVFKNIHDVSASTIKFARGPGHRLAHRQGPSQPANADGLGVGRRCANHCGGLVGWHGLLATVGDAVPEHRRRRDRTGSSGVVQDGGATKPRHGMDAVDGQRPHGRARGHVRHWSLHRVVIVQRITRVEIRRPHRSGRTFIVHAPCVLRFSRHPPAEIGTRTPVRSHSRMT